MDLGDELDALLLDTRPEKPTKSKKAPGESKKATGEWSKTELRALKKAAAEIPSSVEKQERWRQIAERVGTRGKKDCYEKYKELKEAKANKKKKDDDDDDEPEEEEELCDFELQRQRNLARNQELLRQLGLA